MKNKTKQTLFFLLQVPEEASTVDAVPDVAVQERVQNQFK